MALRDHLHIRGEYSEWFTIALQVLGSPPHTWRIQDRYSCYPRWFRITSTYVENTTDILTVICLSKDHLHIRGEYPVCCIICRTKKGSPPHTWRIPFVKVTEGTEYGITSTYVENTIPLGSHDAVHEDHLHIRGEYKLSKRQDLACWGSPPHTWRIRQYWVTTAAHVRITSTYVENTTLPTLIRWTKQDHLHIRGEYC